MNKKGFVSTWLIYTFFILFLLLMIFLISNYSSNRFMLEQYKDDIKNDFMDLTSADISVYYFLCQDDTEDNCEIVSSVESNYKYLFNRCKNGSTINHENGEVTVQATGKDICYVFFKRGE